jgi:4'-phosphopantetheinyl transferase
MDVYWLEQTEANVPTGDDWLSLSEKSLLSTLRFAKRRNDWRLGRWTAKCGVSMFLKVPAEPRVFASIEIRPAPSGAPEVFLENKPAAVAISLSHRAGIAACAMMRSSALLGCDLEIVEPRSDAFFADYFTAAEQSFVAGVSAGDRSRLLALLWSAKESALKALRTGLRLDTRSVMVGPFDALREERECARGGAGVQAGLGRSSKGFDGWRPLQVCHGEGRVLKGWWQHTHDLIRTVVALPPPHPPILLVKAPCFN